MALARPRRLFDDVHGIPVRVIGHRRLGSVICTIRGSPLSTSTLAYMPGTSLRSGFENEARI